MEPYFHFPLCLHGVHRDIFTLNVLCQYCVSRACLRQAFVRCSLQPGCGPEPVVKLLTPIQYRKRTPYVGSLFLRLVTELKVLNCLPDFHETPCRTYLQELQFCANRLGDRRILLKGVKEFLALVFTFSPIWATCGSGHHEIRLKIGAVKAEEPD